MWAQTPFNPQLTPSKAKENHRKPKDRRIPGQDQAGQLHQSARIVWVVYLAL